MFQPQKQQSLSAWRMHTGCREEHRDRATSAASQEHVRGTNTACFLGGDPQRLETQNRILRPSSVELVTYLQALVLVLKALPHYVLCEPRFLASVNLRSCPWRHHCGNCLAPPLRDPSEAWLPRIYQSLAYCFPVQVLLQSLYHFRRVLHQLVLQ